VKIPRANGGRLPLQRPGGGDGRPPVDERIGLITGFGPPALAAIGASALASSIYVGLGVVTGRALGMTPVVYLIAGAFFVLTAMTYLEGNSLHPERGGASTFARYAFDELVAFIAGWAFLLDYLIVMALAAFCIAHYLAAFWGHANDPWIELLIAAAAIGWVAWSNIRGTSTSRTRTLIRLAVLNLALTIAITIIGLAMEWDPGAVIDSIDLGSAPKWEDLLFAAGIATAATTGVEAASGFAGEVRPTRRELKKLVVASAGLAGVLFMGLSTLAVMAAPVRDGSSPLGSGENANAPVLGIVSTLEPDWLMELLRYSVGLVAALVLLQALNGTMLGLARLTYSLTTNRQLPSLIGRLHPQWSTPYVSIGIASVIVFALAATGDVELMLGIFAFGSLLAFTIAHVAVIALRYREPSLPRPFRIPLSVKFAGGSLPIPTLVAALLAAAGWVSVLVLHSGARIVGGLWMVFGIVLYTIYRRQQDKPLRKRFTIPARALQQDTADTEYGSILVPVFGGPLDDDIIGTAGRLAAAESDDGEGGAVIEALYVVEVPMSLPLDARVPDEKIAAAKRAVARAKEVGEEYEGVVVATAMVRARSAGQAIVAEAKRRGVEAIVLGAEETSGMRGGTLLGGRASVREKGLADTTRYVLEKATCRVILTAAPAGEEGQREGVAP
jgi:APA family basic amino acid/polyamine antiporter